MYEYVACGWQPYYMNFMFDALHGTLPAIVAQMHRAIEKGFYGQFCTRFTRNPTAESQRRKLPQLFLFPDLPGQKRERVLVARTDNQRRWIAFQWADAHSPVF